MDNKQLNEQLFDSFKKKYNEQNSSAPFSNTNLFSTIHLSENDHTNILWDIIRYRKNGKYIFLNSFIEDCLRLQQFKMDFKELDLKATQHPSLSNKNESSTDNKYGYIDLLLKDKTKAIIIENKVCDAGDGKNQLARYYYTFAAQNTDNPGFNITSQNTSLNDENIYVVYLTKDDSKIFPAADTNSLPECLQNRLGLKKKDDKSIYTDIDNFSIPNNSRYIHISYSEDILRWLKEKVLPEISAYKSNEFYRSVCLYVDYLENDVLGQTQQSRDIYLTDDYKKIVEDKTWKELYEELLKKPNQEETDESQKPVVAEELKSDESYLNPYINFLRAQVTRKVNEAIITKEWKSYCTPSFVLFYKTEWYNPSSKYNIPPLNLFIYPNKLIKLTTLGNLCFQIEHYKSDNQKWKDNLIDKLGKKSNFIMTNNRGNTPRLIKNGGTITVDVNGKIEIKFDSNIEKAINNCGFPLYAK